MSLGTLAVPEGGVELSAQGFSWRIESFHVPFGISLGKVIESFSQCEMM